jgi:type I restriction enzyme S subunit
MRKEDNMPALRFPEFFGVWKRFKLIEIAEIGRGKSRHRPRDADFLYGGMYPFVQTGDIKSADLYLENFTQTYSEDGLNQSKLWDIGTLCVTIAANIAETAILNIQACFPDSIIGVIPYKEKSTALFIKYQFDNFKTQIQRLSQGLAQDNLNQEKLSQIIFPFPTLIEQNKIAIFISFIDEKLTQFKKQKALLEQYKKGVMQKIFSQEVRFKNEHGEEFPEWGESKFGLLYSFLTTNSLSRDKLNYNSGVVKNIHYGDIHTKFNPLFDITKECVPYINDEMQIAKVKTDNYCKKGDLVIADASEDYNDIGKTIEIVNLNNQKVVAGLHTIMARPDLNKISFGFGAYLMQTDDIHFQIRKISQGTKVLGLSSNKLSDISVNLPCLTEQTKIANFLCSLDDKINHYIVQIEKTEKWKNGLMQKMFC